MKGEAVGTFECAASTEEMIFIKRSSRFSGDNRRQFLKFSVEVRHFVANGFIVGRPFCIVVNNGEG